MSVIDEIRDGESKKLEFKLQMVDRKKIARTIIAFSNTAGGKFLIGVSDNGNVVGVDEDSVPTMIDSLVNIIDDTCVPQIRPSVYSENIDGKIVIVVEVFPGYQKPYYMKSEGISEGVYIRIASTTRKADRNTIRELERERENLTFDEEINYSIDRNKDYENYFFGKFKATAGKTIEEVDLINLKILRKNGTEYLPTNAYTLLIDHGMYLNYATIKCARFKGNNVEHFIDRKEFYCPLYEQIEKTVLFAETHIALSSQITGARRTDKYAIPINAIREAVANAVVHRDYSLNSSITVNIFDNRIEINSPGSLPGTLDIRQIKSGRSEIRNRVAAKVLKEMRYIEEWGTGINRIIAACESEGLKEPLFEEIGQGFKVTIYARNIWEDDFPSESMEVF